MKVDLQRKLLKNFGERKDVFDIEVPVKEKKSSGYDIIVFCHLRWDFVYQRPQHIISRLAQNHSILLIEEPIPFSESERNGFEVTEISSTLHVLKPKVDSIPEIANVLKQLSIGRDVPIGWFYSPAFSVLLPEFDFDTIIYDCMDELSLFKGAPKELIAQEKNLMSRADIVFTGGRALYESKSKNHPFVHCFPSSVDREHFEKALSDIAIPEDVKNLQKPIVGYFGVIDERIDLDLLQKTASKLPHVTFLMIGPLAKIGEEDLPRAKNIHYTGMRSYEELPNYLKTFDIAMMPFALNDATKYISPTKTLEFMAAGVPIISTAIKDVVRHYDHCIKIVETADDFATAIEGFLETQQANNQHYQEILAQTSWDSTVEKMQSLIKKVNK